jgi:hypothetical protein
MSVSPIMTFLHAIHLQGAHAALDRLGEQSATRARSWISFLTVVISHQQFVQTDAALVAGLVALVAADGPVEMELALTAIGLLPAWRSAFGARPA